MSALPEHEWGRVEDDGTVLVREGDSWRSVGQFPDATPDEALAYYVRKFSDLEGQVSILEQRVRRGAPAQDVAKSVAHLRQQIEGASAVGDLASLAARLEALGGSVSELTKEQEQAQRAELAGALAEREEIVAAAERLAAQPAGQIQWKQTSAQMDELFAKWQSHQQHGPRLPKSDANALWKRFRTARSSLDAARRAFFADLDATHKQARDEKQAIIERAEALAPKGADGIGDYRRLLDEWKNVGRAGRKHDDALWARFKAAGDVLFQAKGEVDARENEEYAGNLEAKEALLAEAEPILEITERREAREALASIQRRWDEIGKVPRERFRATEERLRRIEQHVRKLDDEHWQKSNPEKQARSAGMRGQLEEAIDKLEGELEAAKAKGDARAAKKAEEALEARRAWLGALGA